MRNKSFSSVVAVRSCRSPVGVRKALTVKMNTFFEEPGNHDGKTNSAAVKTRRRPRRPRPLTATLDRPRLLDIALLGKIDMSLMSKELLSIYRLMRIPLTGKQERRFVNNNSDENDENVRPVKPKSMKESKITDAVLGVSIVSRRIPTKDAVMVAKKGTRIGYTSESSSGRDGSPLKLGSVRGWNVRVADRRGVRKADEVFTGPTGRPLAPPCDSCGRAARPERFHAHPERSTNQEPVLVPNNEECKVRVTEPAVAGVPMMCSHCGRRFGSASLSIHEAKCRERRESCPSGTAERRQAPPAPRRRTQTHPHRRREEHQKIRTEDEPTSLTHQFSTLPRQQNLAVPAVQHSPRSPSHSPQRGIRTATASPRSPVRSGIPPRLVAGSPRLGESPRETARTSEGGRHQPRIPDIQESTSPRNGRNYDAKSSYMQEPTNTAFSPRVVPKSPGPDQQSNVIASPRPGQVLRSPRPGRVLRSPRAGTSTSPVKAPPAIRLCPADIRVVGNDVRERNSEADDYVFKSNGDLDYETTYHNIWASHLRSLVTCAACERNFAPERIERHQAGCNGSSRRHPSNKNTG